MNTKRKQSGITLMEMTVVVAIVALLAAFGLPAIRTFVNSLESKGPAEAMINAALSSARAIALKEQRYAGIRFQCAYEPNNPKGALASPQYMIFIINETNRDLSGNLANGFRVVEGIEPIKLPDSIGVMEVINSDGEVDDNPSGELTNKTSFSILFSPAGKLVIHDVRVRNRDGVYQPDNSDSDKDKHSMDDIFNSLVNIRDYGVGMFIQDDYGPLGFVEEPSRNAFIIYERDKFKAAFEKGLAYSDYLKNLAPIHINPYTGTIIKQD